MPKPRSKPGDENQSQQIPRGKKRSFAALFDTNGPTITKHQKIDEKLQLTNFKSLMLETVEEQKKLSLVLMLYDYEQIKNLQIVDSKPLNFGLFDKNGITVEVLVFGKNEQMRLQSLLKGITKDDSVLILSGWSWYVNNSKFITGYMIQHKINVTRDTEIRFMKTEILMDSSILHFNFDHSLERLIYGRCFGIIETCWLMVARAPTYFYGSYYGVLVTDGTYFGIIAVTVHDNGDLKTEYKFNQDSIFKLKQVNAKLFDVAHRKLTDSVLQHFGLNDIQKPSVFYVDESTNIINDDTAEVEFGENDESDIVYPEKGKNVSATTLSELFKSLKLK